MEGFPARLIDFIQCSKGCGSLDIEKGQNEAGVITQGILRCSQCCAEYPIHNGILDILDSNESMDDRSCFEMKIRDEIARESKHQFAEIDDFANDTEVSSTLRKLGWLQGKCILELGCGTGRFTRKLINGGATVVAIDFSLDSLSANAKRLEDTEKAGLIHADVSKISLKENSFDLALSTLYSNIPDPEARLACTNIVYQALKPGGTYVLSAHHHEIRDVLKGQPSSGTYDNGIFFQKFTTASIKKELSGIFPRIKTETICIWLPYLSRIASIRSFLSRASESVPLLNRLGSLLLVTCTKS